MGLAKRILIKEKKHHIFLMSFIAICVVGILNYYLVYELSMQSRMWEDRMEISRISMEIDHLIFDRIQESLKSMASNEDIKESVALNHSTKHSKHVVDTYKEITKALVCYIINIDGVVVESTIYKDEKYNFIGNEYSFRPYFMKALKGISNIYPAIGVTSKERGVYFSNPILSNENEVVGVAVIKISGTDFDHILSGFKGEIFVADDQGIIFSSNKKDLLYQYTRPLDQETINQITMSRQFPDIQLTPYSRYMAEDKIQREGRFVFANIKMDNSSWFTGTKNDHTKEFTLNEPQYMLVIAMNAVIGILAIFILFMYITILKERKTEYELKKMYTAIEQSHGSIVITDEQGNIEYVNKKFEQITGYTIKEVLGSNPRILKSGVQAEEHYRMVWEQLTKGKVWTGEFCNKKKNGELYWESTLISPVKNHKGVITNYIAIKEDISERKIMDEKLNYYARFDEMTGALNRRTGLQLLAENMERCKKYGKVFCLFFIDVNNLKIVNDTLGHSAGDALIKSTVDSIKHNMRESDILSRFGGDEFVLVLNDCSRSKAVEVWERIENAFKQSNQEATYSYKISVSYGLVEYDGDENITLDEIIALADHRMYEYKENFKKMQRDKSVL